MTGSSSPVTVCYGNATGSLSSESTKRYTPPYAERALEPRKGLLQVSPTGAGELNYSSPPAVALREYFTQSRTETLDHFKY